LDRFRTDFHNHSARSRCARPEMTVAAMAERFEACGLVMAGISDHVYPDGQIGERCRATRMDVEAARSSVDIRVGAEVDVLYPGRLSVRPEELGCFDYVLLACTHYQGRPAVPPPVSMEPAAVAQNMVDFMTYAASLEFADAIAHPFHATGLEAYEEDPARAGVIELIPDEAFRRIARDMRERGLAIEINTVVLEKGYARAMFRFYAICKEERVKFSLGSDAHWLSGIGEVPLIAGYLESLQLTDGDIWTPERGA
jgi:histidinol phosphatase-like PHP family hydrolase